MISSKQIGILTAIFMVLVLAFTGAMMLYGGNLEAQQTGTAVYAEGFEVEWTEADYNTSVQNASFITLTGESAETDSAKVLVNGGEISILGGGTYVVSGTLEDGSITVNAADNGVVHLILDNASVTSSDFSAIYVKQAGKVLLTMAEGSENSLADGAMYNTEKQSDGKPFAAVYSHDDLTINGKGSLLIHGNYQDGIKCNDTLKIIEGKIQVTAIDEGINVNESLVIRDAELDISSGGDSLHSDGNLALSKGDLTLTSADDAVHAENIAVIEPETLHIADCLEGIEGACVIINDGDIRIVSRDDAINAIGESVSEGMEMIMGMQNREITEEDIYLVINGGNLYVETSGDGIDSNGAIVQNGGTIEVYGPENNGNASLDTAYGLQINGGSLLAAGSSGMAELPHSSSAQNVMVFYLDKSYASGSSIELLNSDGNPVLSGTSSKQFNWVCVSAAEIQQGITYTLQINGETAANLECTETVSTMKTVKNMFQPEETGRGDIPMREKPSGQMPERPSMEQMPENMQMERMPENMRMESVQSSFLEQYGMVIASLLLLTAGFVFVIFYKRKNY